VRYCIADSPIGDLLLTASDHGLTGLYVNGERAVPDGYRLDPTSFADIRAQLDSYFAASRRSFDVELAPAGTPWQQHVWRTLRAIPYGERITYRELAARAGRPTAIRAAGNANGRNPISIIIPCHRVVGSDGSLTGYGGGIAAKQWLLDLEAR
jgi:methylated-DNA-[protein]-cysteine S-methyltransferase